MKIIKNNKGIFITLFIILIFAIAGIFALKAFFPSGNEYGNRLKGIEKVSFSDKEITKLEKEIKDREKVKKVSINIKGKLINIMLTVENDADISDMKDHCKEKLELFDEEELSYYDLQFYLIAEESKESKDDKESKEEKEEDTKYPAIGYKHKTSSEIKWSNN
ncbi:MAG: hypothetical protein E7157_04000 [Lactobacillales bacterium]|nr:hypothetical protein [Lactobacillales bacterium]